MFAALDPSQDVGYKGRHVAVCPHDTTNNPEVTSRSNSITERERKRLDKIIRKSSSVLVKLKSMLHHESHPLQDTLSAPEQLQ